MYKLIITKVLDRKGLAYNLKKIYPKMSVAERLMITDNITDGVPFIDNLYIESLSIENILTTCCQYTYELIPPSDNKNFFTPPWEKPEYIAAKKWYDTLSEEDRKKIDILARANLP